MTNTSDQILQQALQLPLSDREQMVEQLYLSLHGSAEVTATWEKEIVRRINQVENGEVSSVSAEDVHQQIAQLIDRERSSS